MAIFDFRQKNSTVILSMLGVKFQKNKNISFLVCNKGIFFRKVEIQLHSSFKVSIFYIKKKRLEDVLHLLKMQSNLPILQIMTRIGIDSSLLFLVQKRVLLFCCWYYIHLYNISFHVALLITSQYLFVFDCNLLHNFLAKCCFNC